MTQEKPDTWGATYRAADEQISALQAENARLREALRFASSVIKSGEPWTDTCERVIGAALQPEPK